MTAGFFPPLHARGARAALMEGSARHSYAEVDRRIDRLAAGLLDGRADLEEERVAILLPASLDYAAALLGVWRAGGVAVPLNTASAAPELERCLADSGASRLIADAGRHGELAPLCGRLNARLTGAGELAAAEPAALPAVDGDRRAMMLFTSGTTSRPKGVVSAHRTVRAQIVTLLDAWRWTEDDVIPLFLPLHHIHGIINILCCSLWAGATAHLFAGFDAGRVCRLAADGVFNVFMAVPTVYVKLIRHIEALDAREAERVRRGFGAMRLNVSGSAACPVELFERWRELTGQTLLERYGMTEIGMGISNPYDGERRAGFVGRPLPGVEAALFDEDDRRIAGEGAPGEIRVKGESVFLEYWNDEKATRDSFRDGWFRTGDVAVVEDGCYRIMGRSSVDIIKSGGYKLSALEIEGTLLAHEAIGEAAVVGAPDETWGEVVAAFVVLREGARLDHARLKEWCAGRMSAYKIPKILKVVEALPRNAMGKVTKPALKDML